MLKFFVSFLLVTSFAVSAQAQNSLVGRVLDSATRQPMEYVNVILHPDHSDSLVTGTVTGKEGRFDLLPIPSGDYRVRLRFMGYETRTIDNVRVTDARVDLGDITLTPTTIPLGDVVIEGARPTLTYRIDKKVIEVDQMSTAISGTAADVLVNVPSVTVDIEGNVRLRGSSNFTVLVDGKPSVLDPQDALQQIPASTIENIEIITNPSAKYDPEGTAGIINITMKQQRGAGWSGLMNGNIGLKEKYGGDLLLEHKDGSFSALLGIDHNDRLSPGISNSEERYEYQGTTSVIATSGDMEFLRSTFGVRGALEFSVSEQGSMTLNGRYGNREWQRNAILRHNATTGTTSPIASRNFLHRQRGGDFSAINAGYQHLFSKGQPAHKLSLDLMFRYGDSDELTVSELIQNQQLTGGRRTTEGGPSRQLNTRLEYILPFGEKNKFEAGYHGEVDFDEEATTLSELDTATVQYALLPQFSHQVQYRDNRHAWYSLYAGEEGMFGYQAGLRTEYTLRKIRVENAGEFIIDRWDLFPTLHLSYRFSGENQLMASYTRRIDRPRGWELEPFLTWIDATNVRSGNPSLLPEYIDSYELGMQTLLDPVSLSMEVYHRVEHNATEDLRSVYAENVTLTSVHNVGTEYSSGTEFLVTFDAVPGWNVNLVGNLFDYRIQGEVFNEPFSRKSFNWSARFNNLIKVGGSTQFQLNAMWNSPSVSPQGRRDGFASVDVAAKQEFFSKQFSLTLQIQNVLGTARHEMTSSGPGFFSYSYHKMESPVVMLTARLSINNYPPERERPRGGGFGDDDF